MKKNFNKTKGSKISVKLLLVFTSLVLSVACSNNSNNSNTATTTPAPTITVTAVAQNAASVIVTWTEPTNADFLGVTITYTVAGGTASMPVRVAKGTTTQTFTGLSGSSAYTFTVSAVNGSGTLAAGTVSTTTVATAMATTPAVITIGAAIAQRVAGSVTVTWTEPAAANFLGVAITQTLAGTTSAPVRVAKGTTTHTFTGLTGGSAYTITVSAVNGSGTLAAGTVSTTTVATATATPLATDAIALFSLGAQDGNFGFAACQTAIDDNAVTPNLRSRGYTQARFFGSTDTYGFINIATDADALAITEGTAITGNLAAFTSNTGTTAPIRTFGATATGSKAPVTLATMLAVTTGIGADGPFRNGGEFVLTHLGVLSTDFWSFSLNTGLYQTSSSCVGATATTGSGIIGSTGILAESVPSCAATHGVLCIAR